MKNFLPALILGVVGAVGAVAYTNFDFDIKPGVNPRTVVCDVPPPAEKQIIKLPEDGQAYHTSLFLPANWENNAQCRELVAWFDTDNKLRSLKVQSHWHVYTTNDPMYVNRYRTMVPKVPAVIVQKPDGKFVYESGLTSTIPNSPSALAADIQGYLYSNCPNRPRKTPEPTPDDEPPVDKAGPPKLIDGASPGVDTGSPLMLALFGALIGAAVGVGVGYYEQYYNGGKNLFGSF